MENINTVNIVTIILTMSAGPSDLYESCPFCQKALGGEEATLIGQKGAEGINAASRERGDDIVVVAGIHVHASCRKNYVNKKNIATEVKRTTCSGGPSVKRSARVSLGPFNSRSDCVFCGYDVLRSSPKCKVADKPFSSFVKTDTFVTTILEYCNSRNDEWSVPVKGRIEYYMRDLHAADCLYHHSCDVNFRTGRDIPLQYQTEPIGKRKKVGRPTNDDQEQAFLKTCEYLEANDDEQWTVSTLVKKMGELLHHIDALPYGNQYMKYKLGERYGNSVCISTEEGLHDIVTMREKTDQILRSYFMKAKDGDEEAQKKALIQTAARFIKSDIQSGVSSVRDIYPNADDLKLEPSLQYVPPSLRLLLHSLFVGKFTDRKVAAIGQAIVQSARPRSVVAPLQIGLAAQMQYLYRSRFLVDTLNAMGFGSSYSEVQRFEKNAACSVVPDVLGDIDITDTTLLLAADNVDHNIITLDGKGTFHGMGMIGAITPGKKVNQIIPRRRMSDLNITELTKIEIKEYNTAEQIRRRVNFHAIPLLPGSDMSVDILWEMSFRFEQPIPNWQGMMHILHQGCEHPAPSSVVFLPMIDLYPGDKTCIYSTLHYLCKLAAEHNVPPIITFDQPLFWKASEIINEVPDTSCLKDIVLRLGSFHTFMNVLGAIGTLMSGTGLKNMLEVIYGENAVIHMMSGKAVQRAFRGHLLVAKCLTREIVGNVEHHDQEFSSLEEELEELHSSFISGSTDLESLVCSDCIRKIKLALDTEKSKLSENSKTSQLWMQYLWMLEVARELIMSDRSGSWKMHLHAIADCLPIFAAAGHSNYLKSAYLYLQKMTELETESPLVYQKFEMGYHVIRRSNQFWAGLGSDLVIEQTLMRSLKSTGGLTRGSGMTEHQRAIWTMSSPISSGYNIAMQEFSNMSFTTSEQHKDVSPARIDRDSSDMVKLTAKLDTCSPFAPDASLRNIITGVVANDDVNVHQLDAVGRQTLEKMVGQSIFSYSYKRSSKAKTLATATAVKIGDEQTIDPALLFQRFLVVSRTGDLSLDDVMSYELCPFPPALFEAKNLLRKADKPQLAESIRKHVSESSTNVVTDAIPVTEHYVLDGGSLLHRLKWTEGSTYSSIATTYASFTVRHYGNATVVFDGYDGGPSIKDNTHQRRSRSQHQTVNVTDATEFVGKKEEFLSNDKNKQAIINLISDGLQQAGCHVIHAKGDADVDIVQAAVSMSSNMSTTVIGEDTDLLVLLLYHTNVSQGKELFFRSDIHSKTPAKVYNIKGIKQVLGEEICAHLLFVHAFTGCDTTSRIFGIGKKSAFQKLIKGQSAFCSSAQIFCSPRNNSAVIEEGGRKAMIALFNGKQTDTLESIRYSFLSRKVATAKSFVTPERLPPTVSATNLHSQRTYLQVMVWMGIGDAMDPTNWGWGLQDNKLTPIMTKKIPAPESLLKVVRCNCTTGCVTLRCSCRKYGLTCAGACGICQTDYCANLDSAPLWDDEADDDRAY